jgi:hypothetical protein
VEKPEHLQNTAARIANATANACAWVRICVQNKESVPAGTLLLANPALFRPWRDYFPKMS